MDLNAILRIAVELGASDIHMKLDQPPMQRTDGSIAPLPGCPELGEQDLLVIYRSDGSVYANVCCKKSALAKEALREEELE